MKKSLWQWEKHDVVNYLRRNYLESEVEFTTETLIKKIEKGSFYYGYSERKLSKNLFELVKEGYLSVRYTSVKVKPYQNCSKRTEKRFGSKTVALYRMVGREEKINKILQNLGFRDEEFSSGNSERYFED